MPIRDAVAMHISRQNGEDVGSVVAVCTREEAQFLLRSLTYYFEQDRPDPAWHCHVGYVGDELTIAIPVNGDETDTTP